jgi:predicted phage terminase large subunit-like protein
MVLAPTYTLLEDSSLRSFRSIAEQLGVFDSRPRAFKMSPRPYCRLHTGAEFIFRSADEPDRLRGPNLSGVWHDEASLCEEAAFEMAIARLREGGDMGFYTATFTPRGKKHWTYKVFVENRDADTILISATTRSNTFNDPRYVEMVGKKYSSRMRAQELEGIFLDPPGNIFQRDWFRLVDAAPVSGQRLRYWDKSATEDGGCYTAGVLMCRGSDGYFYVEDVIRKQLSTYARDQLILQTAQLDKAKYGYVPQWFEQEPGSAGVDACHATARLLTGFTVHFDKVTGSKENRAMPFEAQAEARNIILLNRSWTGPYLDELCEFPNGKYKDQVDASAGAFTQLAAMHNSSASDLITIPDQQIEIPSLDERIFG